MQLFVPRAWLIVTVVGWASLDLAPLRFALAADSDQTVSRRQVEVPARGNTSDCYFRKGEGSNKPHEGVKPSDVANYVSAFISTLSGVQHVRIAQGEDKSIAFELSKKLPNEIAVSYKTKSICIKAVRLQSNVKFRAARMPVGLGVTLDDAEGIEVIANINGSATSTVIQIKKGSLHRDEAGLLTLNADIPDAMVKKVAISVPLVPHRAPMHELPPETPLARQPATAELLPASYSSVEEPAIVP